MHSKEHSNHFVPPASSSFEEMKTEVLRATSACTVENTATVLFPHFSSQSQAGRFSL